MKISASVAGIAAIGACTAVSVAQTPRHRPALVNIGTSPGGSIFFLDTASIVDHPAVAGAAPATATREATIVTDNSASAAASVDDPTAQVSSRNRVIARCAAGELRVASSTITQKNGQSRTMTYTEQNFAFLRPTEGRFEGNILQAICAR